MWNRHIANSKCSISAYRSLQQQKQVPYYYDINRSYHIAAAATVTARVGATVTANHNNDPASLQRRLLLTSKSVLNDQIVTNHPILFVHDHRLLSMNNTVRNASSSSSLWFFGHYKRRTQQQQQQLHVGTSAYIDQYKHQIIIRQKHSQTQIKRLFKGHPARLRVEKRLWDIDRKHPRVIEPTTTPTTIVDDSMAVATQQQQQEQLATEQHATPIMEGNETSIATTNATTDQQSQDIASTTSSTIEELESEPSSSFLLQYPPIYTIPTVLPNGWFAPMDKTLRPSYPFDIRRTKNKPKDSIGFLPIYTKYRKDGTKVVTRIKKVTGDIQLFVRELRIVLELPQPANQLQSYDAIQFRAGNMIEIQGHRAAEVRRWLGQLGF